MRPSRNINFQKLLIFILSLTLALFLSEMILRVIEDKNQNTGKPVSYNFQQDLELGYRLVPSSANEVIKLNQDGNTICYKLTYSIDQFGRRDLKKVSAKPSTIHLYGDSLFFGEGLKDEDTLQYMLLEHYKVYNHAVFGYGAQHTLRFLEKEKIENIIDETHHGFYLLIPVHLDRVVSSQRATWVSGGPNYQSRDDPQLFYQGDFNRGRKFLTNIFNIVAFFENYSAILRRVDISYFFYSMSYREQLISKILENSARIFAQKYQGKFIVIFHPQWFDTKWRKSYRNIKEYLEKQGVQILDLANKPYTRADMIGEGCDGHHNREFNLKLNNELINFLNKNA